MPRLAPWLTAAAVAAVLAAPASAAPLRAPLSGDIYVQTEAPTGWTVSRSSNGMQFANAHAWVILAVLDGEALKTTSEEGLATAWLNSQNGTAPDAAGAVQIGGLVGQRFRATLHPDSGPGIPAEVRIARIDATHMLMETVAWQPATPDAEVDQAWRIVAASVVVRPAH